MMVAGSLDLCDLWLAMVVAIVVADLWICVAYSLRRCAVCSCMSSFMPSDACGGGRLLDLVHGCSVGVVMMKMPLDSLWWV